MRRAKIVATLGPAMDASGRLEDALEAGIDVVRLNFSHGTHEDHRRRLEHVRKLSERIGRRIGSLGDLQGPKIRFGSLPDDRVQLDEGSEVVLVCGVEDPDDLRHAGDPPELPVDYDRLARDVEPGALLLMNDGLTRLVVSRVVEDRVHCRVVSGGVVESRKGVNLPGVAVSASTLTEKDRTDLEAMVDMGVDWIALSFVRKPDDVEEVREVIHDLGGHQPVIAKLERPEVLDNLSDVIASSDGVMVARGDLGIEVGPERVPPLQKEIIALANSLSRPVITATEMLETMVHSRRPTRAEASDVANAVFDGTDALMLSAETATGEYPVETVRTMGRIIEAAEASPEFLHPPPRPSENASVGSVLARAAVQVAEDLHARALVVFSITGHSVQLVSKFRPRAAILGLSPREDTLGRLALMWGTSGDLVAQKDHSRELVMAAEEACLRRGYDSGEPVVILMGIPGGHGATNSVMVHRLGHSPS